MKLEFRDKLERQSIDLYFEIKDDLERDITVLSAEIKWKLTIDYRSWGIDGFKYELDLMVMAIDIDTVQENDEIQNTRLYAEVKFNSSKNVGRYMCRIYEEVIKDGSFSEEEYVIFPIDLIVEEKPATDTDHRSQLYVKYIELDINSDEKKLKLTI